VLPLNSDFLQHNHYLLAIGRWARMQLDHGSSFL
jgi:hypothetical protein